MINVDDPASAYPDINTVWAAFEARIGVTNSIIFYDPVVRDYVRYVGASCFVWFFLNKSGTMSRHFRYFRLYIDIPLVSNRAFFYAFFKKKIGIF